MRRLTKAALGFVAAVAVATFAGSASPAMAQCSTCPTPTVAFSPVVQPVTVAPVVVAQPVRTGWYPGRLFDNWRMNRWSAHNPTLVAPATVQTVGFAPTVQTVGYAPSVQTVNFAPMAQTVNFAPSAPYVTGYAPMQRTVVSYAPMATTVFSPAVIEPVMSGCSTCATASPCSSCAGATTVVEQASFSSPVSTVAPSGGCSSCAESSSGATYYQQSPATNYQQAAPQGSYPAVPQVAAPPTSGNPPIPQPALPANEPTPAGQNYGAQRPTTESPAAASPSEKSVIDPQPAPDADGTETGVDGSNTSFELKAPQLLDPQNDRTANRPTVDIHNAVYRQPARKANVNTTTNVAKPVTPVSTASQAAASGWTTISER